MIDERIALTVEGAAALLGISRGLAYEMVREGRIPHIRMGRRILVKRRALECMLADIPGQTGWPEDKPARDAN